MADVFVSYAKTDRPLASKLVAMLEAEGWRVWWDTSLATADLYRDEIMKQLATARAVITIWTPNSIKSDWVRAEAGAAKAQGKLIPVKTPDVAYGDIPLPFGEMHTENVGSTDLVRAAVVAQLAKPAVEPTAWALLTKGVKWELLTWWGIIGGAITLFGAISATLKLADWARVLVQHWREWTHAFWEWAFDLLGIPIGLQLELSPFLTFLLFGLSLTIGLAAKYNRTIKNQPLVDKYDSRSFRIKSWRTLFCLILIVVNLILKYLTDLLGEGPYNLVLNLLLKLPYKMAVTILFFDIFIIPPVIIVLFARHRLQAALSVVLTSMFYFIFVVIAADLYFVEFPWSFIEFVIGWSLPVILLSVAPAKAVSRRLLFLAIGLLILIALNELSKLGFDVTAPKLQG
jgi:TIR domain-containing protein